MNFIKATFADTGAVVCIGRLCFFQFRFLSCQNCLDFWNDKSNAKINYVCHGNAAYVKKLPNIESTQVDQSKVVDYLLNTEKMPGAAKARFFKSFGFQIDS